MKFMSVFPRFPRENLLMEVLSKVTSRCNPEILGSCLFFATLKGGRWLCAALFFFLHHAMGLEVTLATMSFAQK